MRPLEILIPLTLAIFLLWPFLTGRQNPRVVNFLPVLAILLLCVHLVVESYRWQMVPLYALAGLIFFSITPRLSKPATGEFKRLSWPAAGLALTMILLAASSAVPALLPVPAIPAPGGPYQVGTHTILLTDPSRQELYSGRDEPRKFMLQVWYPANPGPGERRAPWMNDAIVYGRAISKYLGMPEFFLDHLALSKTPAWQAAPLQPSTGGYPVILFSHGWNGFAAQNTGQALELASRGYMVVAFQHTYGAVMTVFPDGTTAPNNPSALPDDMPEPGYTEAARKLVDQWSGDIAFALDYLTQENQDAASPFFSNLDLNSVGVYGHSTGGGAAIQFCGTDSRCKAVLAMDPFMTPVSQQVLQSGVPQPAFFMFSQRWFDDTGSKNNRLFDEFYSHLDQESQVIGINGTAHYDFTDLPLLSPVAPQLGLKGPLSGKRVTQIVDSYLIAFFETTLKDQTGDLFARPSTYPEVILLH